MRSVPSGPLSTVQKSGQVGLNTRAWPHEICRLETADRRGDEKDGSKQAHSDRVRLLHMKDRAPGPDARDAPAGEGTLPFPDIVDAARASGGEWYIVERDDPREPLADIARARRYLESLAG